MSNLRSLSAVILLVLLTSGCSLPKIIVLHDPLSADEHVQLAGIYESQGKTDLSREHFRAAIKKDKKHVKAWTLLGDLSYRQNDFDEAENAYRKVLRLQPGNGDVRNNLAWVYIRQGERLKKAKDLVAEAISLNPDHKPYYLDTLGVVLLRQGNFQDAIAALKESIDALPKDRQELLSEAFGHLADAYKAAGDENNYKEAAAKAEQFRNKK